VMVPGSLTEVAATAPEVLAPGVDDAWESAAADAADVPAAPSTVPASMTAGGQDADPTTTAPGGPPTLPQRRSRRAAMDRAPTSGHGLPPVATSSRTSATAAPDLTTDQTAEEAGAWIGAFFAATADAPQDRPDTHEPSVATDGTSEDR
jgi:hypothetical protein